MEDTSESALKRAKMTPVEPEPSPGAKVVMGHEKRGYMNGVNSVPTDEKGYVLHLGLKKGDLANRVVVVGSDSRARRLWSHLEDPENCFTKKSDRGFITYTGTFGGVPVSVCATGMGAPMMDFFVREARSVVDGPMIITRFGSCGGLHVDAVPGSVVLNDGGSLCIIRNYDSFLGPAGPESPEPYTMTGVVKPDAELAERLEQTLTASIGCVKGLNEGTMGFYGAQGREDPNFDDRNTDVFDKLQKAHPTVTSMEMESFQLLHLASCSNGSIRACTCAIVAANRASGMPVSCDALHAAETNGGRAILEAITSITL